MRKKDGLYALVPWESKGTRYDFTCDNVVVGSVILLDNRERDTLEVWSLEVFPPYRGLGHAKELMQAIYGIGKSLGKKTVWLRCNKDNAVAMALYKREGFKIVEERWHDYSLERRMLSMERGI